MRRSSRERGSSKKLLPIETNKRNKAKTSHATVIPDDEETVDAEPVVSSWDEMRLRTFFDGATEEKRLPSFARKIGKAGILIDKTKKLLEARETKSHEIEGDVAGDHAKLLKPKRPGKMVEELLATGWNCNKLDTLACLGMVDKETLKNFTRSFREEEMEKHQACSSSPLHTSMNESPVKEADPICPEGFSPNLPPSLPRNDWRNRASFATAELGEFAMLNRNISDPLPDMEAFSSPIVLARQRSQTLECPSPGPGTSLFVFGPSAHRRSSRSLQSIDAAPSPLTQAHCADPLPLPVHKPAQELKLCEELGIKLKKTTKKKNGTSNVGRTRSRSASPTPVAKTPLGKMSAAAFLRQPESTSTDVTSEMPRHKAFLSESPFQASYHALALIEDLREDTKGQMKSLMDLKFTNSENSDKELVFCQMISNHDIRISSAKRGVGDSSGEVVLHESKISDLNVELVEDPSGKCNCLEVSMQLSSGTSSPLHDLLGRTHSPTLNSPTSTHKNSSPIAKDSMVSTREPSAKTKSKNDVQARNLFQGGAGHEKVYLQSKDPKLVQMWFQALNLGQKTTATPLFSRVPSSDLRRASTTRQTSMNARSGAAHQPLNANKLAQELKLAQETGTKSNKKKVRNGNGNVGRTRSRSASPRSGQTLTAQKLAQELRLAQEIDKMLHLRKQKSRAGAGDFSRTRSRSASPSVQGAHGRMQDNVAAKESGVQRTSYERGRPKTRCA